MNNHRRERLKQVRENLLEIQVEVNEIVVEENEAYDNLPDGIRDSASGQKMSNNVDTMYSIISEMETMDQKLLDLLES